MCYWTAQLKMADTESLTPPFAPAGAEKSASVHVDLERLQLLAPEGVLVGDVAGPFGAGARGRRFDAVLGQRRGPLRILHCLLGLGRDGVEQDIGCVGGRKQAVPQVKVGNLKALAVTGDHRLSSLPDVPTLKEQGIDTLINGWHGLFAPAGAPDALLDTIALKAKQAMTDPKWAAALAKDGVEAPPARTRAEWTRYIADEHAFWGKKLKALKIDVD